MTELWTPAPFAVSAGNTFLSSELEAFECELLENPRATEHDASRFFERYPKFLHLGHGAEVRREVVLFRPGDGPKARVDFFRRSFGRAFWDIIELKSPGKKLLIEGDGRHSRHSSEVFAAINQAMDYRKLIGEAPDIRNQLAAKGIRVCCPQLLVIIGRKDRSIDPERLEVLYDRIRAFGAVEALSYTDLYEFAKEQYKSTKLVVIPALHFFDGKQGIAQSPQTSIDLAIDLTLGKLGKPERQALTQFFLAPSHQEGSIVGMTEPDIRSLVARVVLKIEDELQLQVVADLPRT